MAKNESIPDAWDDDWEAQADNMGGAKLDQGDKEAEQGAMTRAERLAKHAESQRKLWESADTPQEPQFLPTGNTVPLATTFKPALKVLSRKPAPKMVTKKDPVTGMERLAIDDDEDEDAEARKSQPSAEEVRLRQQKEREERQRRYDEARAKIFGDSSASPGSSTPGNVTPPQQPGESRPSHRTRGKGRGGGGGGGAARNAEGRAESRRDSPSTRAASGQSGATRELYDPNYSPKPVGAIQKRPTDSTPQTSRPEIQPVRAPRGPDSSGRGGFGFATQSTKDG